MKLKTAQERGVHAASTSAPQDASPRADAMAGRTVKRAKARAPRPPGKLWQLRLYVVDQTPKSVTAFSNLKKFCETHLKGLYRIKVIDLLKHPQLAKGDQILAIPTVVRKLPKPVCRSPCAPSSAIFPIPSACSSAWICARRINGDGCP